MAFAQKTKLEGKTALDGLYMPFLIEKNLVVRTGGFLPGNIFHSGVGAGGVERTSGASTFSRIFKEAVGSAAFHFPKFDCVSSSRWRAFRMK